MNKKTKKQDIQMLKKKSRKEMEGELNNEQLDQMLDPTENFFQKTKKSKKQLKESNKPLVEVPQLYNEIISVPQQKQTSAWEDEDDQNIQIDISKVARLRKLRKNDSETIITGSDYQKRLQDFYNEKLNQTDFFKWGDQKQENNEYQSEDLIYGESKLKQLIQGDRNFYERQNYKLQNLEQGVLDLDRFGSVLQKDKHDAVVQTLDFYKDTNMFLSGALDNLVKIFCLSDAHEENVKNKVRLIKSIYMEGLPIKKAQFVGKQNEIIAAGLKKHLLCYSMESDKILKSASALYTSKFSKQIDTFCLSPQEDYIALYNQQGSIMILSAKTKQLLFELKINDGYVIEASFSQDSKYLYTTSSRGKIHQWDLSKRQIFNCIADQGSNKTNCINVSNKYIVTGSDQSHVNLYDIQNNNINKTPAKEFLNLTTSITGVEINTQNEIVCMFSKWKKNAIRFIHLPSMTVFNNWPNLRTKLNFISTTKFSKDGRYILIGNDEGQCQVYNFEHYNE